MSKRIPYELYNPAMTIAENANSLGCSVATVRKYIRNKGIDRQYDAAYNIWKTIYDYNQKNPGRSYKEKQKALGYSINTIKKYEALSEEGLLQSKRDTNKVSKFDLKNRNAIKSISTSQDEILQWIIHLYNDDKTFDADLTASKLVFYKKIPTPEHLYDINPTHGGIRHLRETDVIPGESFTSIIYDLPFLISQGEKGVIANRFSYFSSPAEMYAVNNEMIERACRLLKKNGLLVIKTMDIVYAGRQYWVSDYVINQAQGNGFEMVDKFILVANGKLISNIRRQQHARKWHSYFLVFRKK